MCSARENDAQSARNARWQRSARERGIFFCAGRENVAACAGMGGSIRAECSATMFRAGKGYLFLRRKEKCSRLRGILWLSPRGMFGGNVLCGNLGIFMDGIAVEERDMGCSSSCGGCRVCFYSQSSTVTVKVIGWRTFSNWLFMIA